MQYRVEVATSAEKSLAKIPKKDRERIVEEIASLGEDPRPIGCKKLQGSTKPALYRIRSGNYRIVYTIKDEILLVLVVKIGDRKEVYK